MNNAYLATQPFISPRTSTTDLNRAFLDMTLLGE